MTKKRNKTSVATSNVCRKCGRTLYQNRCIAKDCEGRPDFNGELSIISLLDLKTKSVEVERKIKNCTDNHERTNLLWFSQVLRDEIDLRETQSRKK